MTAATDIDSSADSPLSMAGMAKFWANREW